MESISKECFKCKSTKTLSDFYAHPQMADGHLNKCKECTKVDVRERYSVARESRSIYERQRNQTAKRRLQQKRYLLKQRTENPEKAKAYSAVSNAIRDGRLIRQPCEVCGTTKKVEGHHDDYSKPLDVRWLCFRHHREVHGQVVIAT